MKIVFLICMLFAAISLRAIAAVEPEIKIKGGTKSLRNNILQHLSIGSAKCKAASWRLNSYLDAAESEIQSAAQALGYYRLTYQANLVQNKECWGLNIELAPGEPVRIKEVRIDILGEGRADPAFQQLYDNPGIKLASKFHHGKYEDLKSRFESAATANGFFDGYFPLSRVLVDEKEALATIELTYDTGRRYRIANIHVQQAILQDEFVSRYHNIHRDDYYTTEALLELKNLYNSSNYFSSVSVSPNMDEKQDGKVDIDIQLTERKRREYSAGVGYETDTGPRFLLGFEDRYINRHGHFLNADLSVADSKKEFQTVYTLPLEKPAFEFLKFFTGYIKEELDDSWSRKRSLGSSYTYYQASKWLQTYAITYEREDSIVGTDPLNTTDLIIPSFTISRTKTDAAAYPLQGWTVSSRLSGSPESLGSDYSFLQWYSRAKYIWGGRYGRLLLRGELGMTKTEDFNLLPVSVRYYAGGDASVRGYDYKSLGVIETKNGEEVVIGGSNLVTQSIEYDHMIGETNWVAAVFYDQGNAFDNSNVDLKRSVGLGLRWISPIGPVRVDFAKALDDEKGWALHITMGPDL